MRARMALKLANIKCEIREVRLNNKPKDMLEASPKGTVPVFVLKDKIIDESIEIINWVVSKSDLFKGNISHEKIILTERLINTFDNDFKYHLDRYKYSTRYGDIDIAEHRNECMKILIELDGMLSQDIWFFGKKVNKLDISILPFIRQFRIANTEWFDQQKEIKNVQRLLNNFLESSLFKDVMFNYKVWEEGIEPIYFP
tara:strand:+ start:462 stop:1058 length:597 start_codon:yes stop_codon:yes gene_type:complete